MNEIFIRAEEPGQTALEYWDEVRAGNPAGDGKIFTTQPEAESALASNPAQYSSIAEFDPDDGDDETEPQGPSDEFRVE